jgi:hypothetical protein
MPCVYLPGPAPAVTVANNTDIIVVLNCTIYYWRSYYGYFINSSRYNLNSSNLAVRLYEVGAGLQIIE